MGTGYEPVLQVSFLKGARNDEAMGPEMQNIQDKRINHREIERWYRLKNMRKAIQALAFASIIAMISGFAISRYTSEPEPVFKPSNLSEPGIKVEKFSYSSVGAHQWDLEASSATVAEAMDHVELKLPRIVYYTGDGSKILLNADTGNLDKKAGTVTAKGGVTIKFNDFMFRTHDINYSQGTLEAQASESIFMEGADMKLSGKGLRLFVDKEEVIIEQDVKASLFNVKWVERGKKLPI